jgi:hypothetical protein
MVSWPAAVTGHTLEANTNLNSILWSVVSPEPVISGTNNVVTNQIDAQSRFYHLRQ